MSSDSDPDIAPPAKKKTSTQKRNVDSTSPDSDPDISPPAKKKNLTPKSTSRKSSTSKHPTYTTAELSSLSHTDLLTYAISLQSQLDANPASPSTKELTPAEIDKKVAHLQTLMTRQIKKAMTWKPSCKTGSATFSQDFIVQSEQVLKALFKPVIKEGGKAWKMKKFSVAEFQVMSTLSQAGGGLIADRSSSRRLCIVIFKAVPAITISCSRAMLPCVGMRRMGL